jgi:hypothetical protein
MKKYDGVLEEARLIVLHSGRFEQSAHVVFIHNFGKSEVR